MRQLSYQPALASNLFPDRIALPNGWRPDGIAVGARGDFYVGSIGTGSVWKGSLRTGEGRVLVPGGRGRSAIGVDVDNRDRLFVAGGATGQAYVYDGRSGADIAAYQLASPPTFINDVVVTRRSAYFTDSRSAFLHRIPIAPSGDLAGLAEAIPLPGIPVNPLEFNLNGIDATPNGKTLVAVQSNTGKLFTIDPATGVAKEIDLGGASVPNGDGILLDGRRLYVVQNQLNQIAVIELAPDLSSGTLVGVITDDDLDVPTTIDEFGHRLYVVNARFTTPPTPETEYWITKLTKP